MSDERAWNVEDLVKNIVRKPQGPLSPARRKYNADRNSWSRGKALLALTHLHNKDYRILLDQARDWYDRENGPAPD